MDVLRLRGGMHKIRPVVGLPRLTWLRAFEAAARTSSFAAAAAALSQTCGARSYQSSALEAHLGLTLFERRARGVRLTPMGVAYLPPVRKAFEDLADSTAGLFGGSERSHIGVHAPVSFAALWLAPRLPAFRAAHSRVDVRLSSVIWDHAAPDPATDLEIRYGGGNWHGYRADPLFRQPIVAVCAPRLLEAATPKVTASELLARHLLPIMGYERHWLAAREALALDEIAPPERLTVDTTVAALELAAAGAGCVLTHPLFLGAYLAGGRLVRMLAQEFADEQSYFVLTPERPQRLRREVRLFRDWLSGAASSSPSATMAA